jgi:phage terminase small subunit
MPMLDNTRHEKFARGLANGLTATEAYANAGYAKNRSSACRLSTNINIRGRVAELRAEALKNNQASIAISLASLTEMLLKDRELAHRTKQASAAVTATERLARLHGYMFDGKGKVTPASDSENRSDASERANVVVFDVNELRERYLGRAKPGGTGG